MDRGPARRESASGMGDDLTTGRLQAHNSAAGGKLRVLRRQKSLAAKLLHLNSLFINHIILEFRGGESLATPSPVVSLVRCWRSVNEYSVDGIRGLEGGFSPHQGLSSVMAGFAQTVPVNGVTLLWWLQHQPFVRRSRG